MVPVLDIRDIVSRESNVLAVRLKKHHSEWFFSYDLVRYAHSAGKNVLVLNVRPSQRAPLLQEG